MYEEEESRIQEVRAESADAIAAEFGRDGAGETPGEGGIGAEFLRSVGLSSACQPFSVTSLPI